MTEATRKDLDRIFTIIDAFVDAGITRHFMTDAQPVATLEERLSENSEHIRNFKAQAMSLKYKVEQWAKAYDEKDGDVK